MADVQTLPSVEEVEAGIPPETEAYEIVDGRVLLTVGATRPHQHVVNEMGTDLTIWARPRGAVVVPQPFDVRTTPTRQRQPDLLVVLAEHRDRIGHGGMEGPPDLVVEVLSPSTRAVDLGEKRAEYAGIGVGEYLCIDPETGETFTASPPDAPWRRLGRGEVWRSAVLDGFEVPLDRILPPREP